MGVLNMNGKRWNLEEEFGKACSKVIRDLRKGMGKPTSAQVLEILGASIWQISEQLLDEEKAHKKALGVIVRKRFKAPRSLKEKRRKARIEGISKSFFGKIDARATKKIKREQELDRVLEETIAKYFSPNTTPPQVYELPKPVLLPPPNEYIAQVFSSP
jgi:hypothetical protein